MEKKLLASYVKIEAKLKALAEEKEAIRDEIMTALSNEGIDKAETDTYSPAVKVLEEKVKLAKVKEEQNGKAVQKVSEHLRYTAPYDEAA
jgi:flagellar biosynthesis chaperone FliJ